MLSLMVMNIVRQIRKVKNCIFTGYINESKGFQLFDLKKRN